MGVIPSLNKAVHVDDPLYVGLAQRILENPLDPYRGSAPWGSGDWFEVNWNPPLWSYVLAISAAAGGFQTAFFGVIAALAYAALVLGLFCLLRRASVRPLQWTILLAWSPFLLPGRNLMVDAPMLALWVWALECRIRAAEQNRTVFDWLAGLLSAAAILTKYTAVLLIFVLGFGLTNTSSRRRMVALLPPIFVLALWHGLLWMRYAQSPIGIALQEFDPWLDRLRILCRNTGGVTWLAFVWTLALCGRNCRSALMLAGVWLFGLLAGWLDASSAVAQVSRSGVAVPASHFVQFLVFTSNGVATLIIGAALAIRIIRNARHGIALAILVWTAAGLLFNLTCVPSVPFGAIRHLAVFLVPLVVASAGPVDSLLSSSRSARCLWYATATAQCALAFLLASADWQLADVYRRVSTDVIGPMSRQAVVRFAGDPSFRYYAEAHGGRVWTPQDLPSAPRPGEFLVLTYVYHVKHVGAMGDEFLARLHVHRYESFETWNPLRTVSQFANFYGGSTTSLPWEFAAVPIIEPGEPIHLLSPPLEAVLVYQVR
jgi:4-amino-4-deoxy-L-arabinose transferase-like glycosyltransferase